MAFPVEGSQYDNRIYRNGVYRYTSELAVGELTVTGNHTLGVEKTVNVNVGTATITVPTLELGEMKVIRKISATVGTITINLPATHTFSDGSSSITLTNQYEEVTIERVSSTKWTSTIEYKNPLQNIIDPAFIDEFGSLTGTSKWYGGVLAPNGKIYGIPYNSTTVLEIDPVTKTTSTFGSLTGTYKWLGGVLAPNGKIYGIPFNSTTVLEIDPVTKTTSTFGSLTGTYKWLCGVLAPNGKIYGISYDSTTVLEIDPVTKTTSTFGSLTGTSKWFGGVLAPNGKIYGIPYNSTTVLEIDPVIKGNNYWQLSAYTNKL